MSESIVAYRARSGKKLAGVVVIQLLSLIPLGLLYYHFQTIAQDESIMKLIRGMLWLGVLMAIGSAALLAWLAAARNRERGPELVLDDEGLWVRHFGFAPWSNVAQVQHCVADDPARAALKVWLVDIAPLVSQADWWGRQCLFWGKIMGVAPITIVNADIPIDVIFACAQRHLPR